MNNQSVEEQQLAILRAAELEALPVISFADLQAVFNKWMLIPDPYILKYIMSCYCANELSQRPVWSIIIAPSGGGKTEFLNSLLPLPKIYSVSTVTPNTFLSGMPGAKDASLLPKLSGKIMLIKDWTVILSMQKDARAEIFGQLRDIHDGSMTKVFGNGQVRTWTGKVSILAACTEAIDMNQQQYTHLGERFIFYRPLMPDRTEVAFRSLKNASKQQDMTRALQNAVFSFLKGVDFTQQTLPELPMPVQEELVKLAEFTTKSRSGVIRDFGFKKEVLFVPSAEMPTRLLQQVALIGQGAMMVNGGSLKDEDIHMMYKTMLDSIPRTNSLVINEMAKADAQTTAEIAAALGYPTETIRTYLENQALLGVCERIKDQGTSDRWTMRADYSEIIREYHKVRVLSPDEIKKRKAEAELLEGVVEVFGPDKTAGRNPYNESDEPVLDMIQQPLL